MDQTTTSHDRSERVPRIERRAADHALGPRGRCRSPQATARNSGSTHLEPRAEPSESVAPLHPRAFSPYCPKPILVLRSITQTDNQSAFLIRGTDALKPQHVIRVMHEAFHRFANSSEETLVIDDRKRSKAGKESLCRAAV